MKNTLRLCTQTLLTLGLFTTSAQAEFFGYFQIPNPNIGVGAYISVPPHSSFFLGNWMVEAGSGPAYLYRSPDSTSAATAFTLTASPNSTATFSILGEPTSSYSVYFVYNFYPYPGAHAYYSDGTGYHVISNSVGEITASITSDAVFVFGVVAGPNHDAAFHVQNWDSTPVTAPPPALSVVRSNNTIIVSWPSPSTGFVLQQSINPANADGWATSGFSITDNGTKKSITIPAPTGNTFFRLFKAS